MALEDARWREKQWTGCDERAHDLGDVETIKCQDWPWPSWQGKISQVAWYEKGLKVKTLNRDLILKRMFSFTLAVVEGDILHCLVFFSVLSRALSRTNLATWAGLGHCRKTLQLPTYSPPPWMLTPPESVRKGAAIIGAMNAPCEKVKVKNVSE